MATIVEQKSREVVEVVRTPQLTVAPKPGGGWHVSGQSQTYRTQAEATKAARAELAAAGGELVIKGRDGRVREQSTIQRRDPI